MPARLKQTGFTIIEMIVSLAVFSFVITIAIGALLMLVNTNNKLQGEQSVMTNLSFALDAMTREIRTGTFYYCGSSPNYSSGGGANLFKAGNNLDTILKTGSVYKTFDCASGNNSADNLHGVAFIEGGNSISLTNERILYFFDKTSGTLYRRTGTNAAEAIVSSGVTIKNLEFFVTGSPKLGSSLTQVYQPTVTIYIEATDPMDTSLTPKSYYLQTTVTQRILDL